MKHIIILLTALAAVFAPAKAALLTVMTLSMADLVLGLIAAKKRGEAITSSGLKRTIAKIAVYETACLLAFLTETYLMDGVLPVMKLVTTLIGGTELKSVLEHLDELAGGSFFSTIVTKLLPRDKPPAP